MRAIISLLIKRRRYCVSPSYVAETASEYPSKQTTSFQRRFDVQTTLYRRQNDVVCLLGYTSVSFRPEASFSGFFLEDCSSNRYSIIPSISGEMFQNG